jgi:hypothetical protein
MLSPRVYRTVAARFNVGRTVSPRGRVSVGMSGFVAGVGTRPLRERHGRPDAVVVGQPTLLLGWTQRLLGSRLSSLVVVEGKWGSPLQRCRWSSRGETHRDTQQSTGPCREMRASESVLVRSLIVVNRFTGDAARLLSVRWKPFKRPLSERWV